MFLLVKLNIPFSRKISGMILNIITKVSFLNIVDFRSLEYQPLRPALVLMNCAWSPKSPFASGRAPLRAIQMWLPAIYSNRKTNQGCVQFLVP